MEPKDEMVHEYPKPPEGPWKENWYFNFIDRENKAWGINHISLMRHLNQGRFSAFHIVDEEIIMSSNLIDIGDDFSELTDGNLKFEFLEPGKRFRVTFTGPRHQVELNYDARFEVFDYSGDRPVKPGRGDALRLNHYEQGLVVKGTLTKDDKTRPIECFGHRDHSWGYRNESWVTGWNWIAVQFEDKTINLSKVVIGDAFIGSGFVSTAEGNTRIERVAIENTRFDNGVPVSSSFTGWDREGRAWRLKSEKFSGLVLPMQDKEKGVIVYENFADYTLLDTNEKGVGIDEYLINPEG